MLTVSDVMLQLPESDGQVASVSQQALTESAASSTEALASAVGPVTETREPQAIFSDETLDQALRQLVLYGRVGLPVLSPDGVHLRGWITRHNVLRGLAERVGSSAREAERGSLAAEFSEKDAASRVHVPRTPLGGYEIVEVTIRPGSPVLGRRIGEVPWPPASIVVAASEKGELVTHRSDLELRSGERVVLLAPTRTPTETAKDEPSTEGG